MSHAFYRGVFVVAAGYDLVLGLAFFLFFPALYAWLGAPLPETASYLQMAAAFVFVQGVGYGFVAARMERNADLVRVGIVYKAAYAGVCFYYWALGELPHFAFAVFGLLDLVFLALFALWLLRGRQAAPAA